MLRGPAGNKYIAIHTVTYARNIRTIRTTNWRQMGHSLSCFPHAMHVARWPHSKITHSTGASMQILQSWSVLMVSNPVSRKETHINIPI